MKIIHVIEDDPVFAFLVKKYFRDQYKIKTYASVDEYNSESEVPDLALVDFNLGEESSGLELLKKLRGTKIIAMSSNSGEEVWNFALKSGVGDFFQKGKQSLRELSVKIKLC